MSLSPNSIQSSKLTSWLALLSALILSGVSGYFSVVGLATLFSGSFIAVVIMAAALECSKIISTAWLKTNWDIASTFLKTYLIISVVVLSMITSMGTFGYLSKAHLQQNAEVGQTSLQIAPLEYQISLEERKLKNTQNTLDSLDKISGSADVKDASYVHDRQKRERKFLEDEINQTSANLERLNAQLLPLKSHQQTVEADLGPLKYIAEMIYDKDAESHFGSAVRFVIILIVLVFDPLAIILLLAATTGIKYKPKPPPFETKRKRGKKIVEVPTHSIMKFVGD